MLPRCVNQPEHSKSASRSSGSHRSRLGNFEVTWDPEFSVLREPCVASLTELEICKGRQLFVADILNFSFEPWH